MSKSKQIRVPSTTVDLILMLGRILRDHLKLELFETECWTFEHVADWEIPVPEPGPEANASEWQWYEYQSMRGEHEMTVYLGSGHCLARQHGQTGNPMTLELRVRCELGEWVPASLSMWDFKIWMKLPGGSIVRHHYDCSLGFGTSRDISEIPLTESNMPDNPPRKIAFRRDRIAQAS